MDFETLGSGLKILATTPVGEGGQVLSHNFALLNGIVTKLYHTHEQTTPSAVWVIEHNLGRYPSHVSIRAPDGIVIHADLRHPDTNTTTITFGIVDADTNWNLATGTASLS